LHLGNYVGAVRPAIAASRESGAESFFFMADYHALIKCDEPDRIETSRLQIAATWLAAGLDTSRVTFYRQSDIPEIPELTWLLTCVTSKGQMNRAHAYKGAVDANLAAGEDPDAGITMGLYSYPILMAADILLYDSDVVPVGRDQRQHLELTIDWAGKFNRQYAPGYDSQKRTGGLLKIPAARTRDETAQVPGRDGKKMSKSYANTIDLFGTDKEVEKQIKSVITDSTAPDAAKPVENQPLYDLLKVSLSPADFAVIDAKWRAAGGEPKTHGYGAFKQALLDAYHATFDPARKRYGELMNDRAELERLLKIGADKARTYAAPVISRVRGAVGL